MPSIFIPPLGTVIQLDQDWTFSLFNESRNDRLIEIAGILPPFRTRDNVYAWKDMTFAERAAAIDKTDWAYTRAEGMSPDSSYNYWSGDWEHQFTFREGTELKVNRIYIRRGLTGFDSVTFSTKCWVSAPGDPLFTAPRKTKSLTFWAKLRDVNRMSGRVLPD